MLTSITQVNTEFFKLFHGIKIPIKGSNVSIPSRYYKKSSYNYVEDTSEVYPCITIQDFSPEVKPEWFIDMKSRISGVSSDGLTAYLYRNPVWMNFRYDVGLASKGYIETQSMRDYFQKLFNSEVGFIFNKEIIDDEVIGDVVPYTMVMTDIPRNDGIFETNMEFNLSAWIYLVEPKEVELITSIITSVTPIKME